MMYPKIASFKTRDALRGHLRSLGLELPVDPSPLSAQEGSPLARPITIPGCAITPGNRLCIHPMEGWDGTPGGEPTEHTLRRWHNFGASAAKLIWGGEAFAVQGDGRANPNQLGVVGGDYARAERGLRALLDTLVAAHCEHVGSSDDLLIGLQLTHSGRFCRPNDKKKLEPKIAYHHPLLDPKFGIRADDDVVISDDALYRLIDSYIAAARLAQKVGFHFVDVKHCHGYLGHELLSAFTREGDFGGSFENRTRFARLIIQGIQAECPGLAIGMRLSAFDRPPYHAGPDGVGVPHDDPSHLPYRYGFGLNPDNPLQIDFAEPVALINLLESMGVRLINVTCGSPYYNPHIQRPALFPPSDGYLPPEDPLVGVARLIHATRVLKIACPNSIFVGTGYTYLQEYLPHVAQDAVRRNWVDVVGVGRLVLSYWDLPHDLLAGRPLQARRLCRTFSDCTTAPRNGMISGCFPLDEHYKLLPERDLLKQTKAAARIRQ